MTCDHCGEKVDLLYNIPSGAWAAKCVCLPCLKAIAPEEYERLLAHLDNKVVWKVVWHVRETTTCVHHWLVAVPAGPTSEGRCRKCGAVREFFNSFEYDRQQPPLVGKAWKKGRVRRAKFIP